METKPEWVPDRIWELWLDHRETNFCWDPCGDEPSFIHPRPLTQKAMLDAGCRCVWLAVDRRYEEGAIRQTLDVIDAAAEGPRGSHPDMPHAQRKLIGKRVARLSGELSEALRDLSAAASQILYERGLELPLEIRVPLDSALIAAAESGKKLYASGRNGFELSMQEFVLATSIARDFDAALDAIRAGSLKWAATRPEVTAKGQSPRRLYYVRELTRHFRARFGTPLREQVAALTRCAFDCEMDAATVAKLAP